jgi:predicted GNAT family acetyltransferase
MSVVRHASPDAFLAAAQPVIARDEAMASSFVAGARAPNANPRDADIIYLATYANGDAFGAAIRRGGGPLWVGPSDARAAAAFAEDLFAASNGSTATLSGIAGAQVACDAFARAWAALTGRTCALRFRMRNHKLTRVAPLSPTSGIPRIATMADTDWLINAHLAFIKEARVPDEPARVRAFVPGRVAQGRVWICDDAEPAAFAGWTDAPPAAARIAPVYTMPHLRGRGHATVLVASLSQALLDGGRHALFLTTDLANPTSNAVYARIGFRPVSEVFQYDFVDAGNRGASH